MDKTEIGTEFEVLLERHVTTAAVYLAAAVAVRNSEGGSVLLWETDLHDMLKAVEARKKEAVAEVSK